MAAASTSRRIALEPASPPGYEKAMKHPSWRRFIPIKRLREAAPVVAVLRLHGVIGPRSGPLRPSLDIAGLAGRIEVAFETKRLVAVAISVNSPGGTPAQSALIGGRPGGVSAAGALEEAQIVVGSGFVSHVSSLTPVGLLQIDGEILSDMQPYGYTRVLGVRSAAIGVLGHREFHRGMYHSAIQLGPGIVEQGRLDISEQDLQRPRYLRAFVATCGRTAIAGVSMRPVHLHTLGKRLLAFFERAGLVCGEVVNLAGDREAVLAMAAPDGKRFAYFGHPKTAKAALVGFKRRD